MLNTRDNKKTRGRSWVLCRHICKQYLYGKSMLLTYSHKNLTVAMNKSLGNKQTLSMKPDPDTHRHILQYH